MTDRSIDIGPYNAAFVGSGVLAVIALFVVPAVGLAALVVIPIGYLMVPRWSCDIADVRVRRGSMLGVLASFVLSKSSGGIDIGIWLPQPSRLANLLQDRGMAVN